MKEIVEEKMKKKRLMAITIDFLVACLIVLVVETIINLSVKEVLPFGVFGLIAGVHFSFYWLLCKDCYKGMSFGKRIMGIQIINLKTHNIAGPLRCVARNLCYCLHFIELVIFFASPKGQRIGDILTSTKVVQKNGCLQQKMASGFYIYRFFIYLDIRSCNFLYKIKVSYYAMI